MHAFLNFIILGRGLCPSPDPTQLLFEIEFFIKKSEILLCKSMQKEGRKVNIEENGRVLKNLGTYWNIRHH